MLLMGKERCLQLSLVHPLLSQQQQQSQFQPPNRKKDTLTLTEGRSFTVLVLCVTVALLGLKALRRKPTINSTQC